MCKYNFLAWEWIEVQLYVYWKYLLFFTNALTAFLLCTADMNIEFRQGGKVLLQIYSYYKDFLSVRTSIYIFCIDKYY